MYLSNTTEKIEIVLAGAIATNQLEWTASYQDITSAGMTLPQSSSQGLTNNGTAVDMVAAPAASTNRQVVHITVYNDDTAAATVKIRKDVSGTEYIYVNQTLQPGDTLQWSREDGWRILSGTSQARYTFDVYNTAGSFTWTKPAGLKAAFIFCGGAGGGAGSGYRGAAGINRLGGGGAGGGGFSWQLIDASSLASSVIVTVGAGGTGGAGVLVDSTNGNNGTSGGDSSFGGTVIAKGGAFGSGATTTTATNGGGGSATTSTIPYSPYSVRGADGNSGQTSTAAGGNAGMSNLYGGGAGGAGGSGITSANVSATTAGAGGGLYQNGVAVAGPNAGATPNGINNKSLYLHFNSTLSNTLGIGPGTAGAGGYPAFKDGGNGGYCAGGGGGSGVLNGTTSGKGGNGGDGLCIVMNIF